MKPLEALNRLNDIAASFMVTQAFSAACNLGVFEELSRGPSTAEELARKLSVHPDGCRRLLAVLRQLGLVEPTSDRYRNSELGDFLTSQSAVPLEPLSMWGSPWPHMWEFLLDALKEFSPRWQQALGTTAEETFTALYEDPVRLRRFCQLMDAFSLPIGQEIAERFDFTPHRCVLDVAGGPGGLAIQVGRKYPHLRGIIMDLPPVCRVAEERIQVSGLSGVLLISETVLNNDLSGTQFGVLLSLHMLVVCEPGAKERSEAEYRTLLEEAGFRDIEVARLGAPRDLIIARKP